MQQTTTDREGAMEKQTLEQRAAAALDKTHAIGERGPKTFNARQRIALALDSTSKVAIADVRWLEQVGG